LRRISGFNYYENQHRNEILNPDNYNYYSDLTQVVKQVSSECATGGANSNDPMCTDYGRWGRVHGDYGRSRQTLITRDVVEYADEFPKKLDIGRSGNA
jgi:hypothetical protein